jgi:L-aspartate oxidase
VGIVRSETGLASAISTFEELARSAEPSRPEDLAGPVANAILTASLIARGAVARTESRGAHYRVDYPRPKAGWAKHIALRSSPTPAAR